MRTIIDSDVIIPIGLVKKMVLLLTLTLLHFSTSAGSTVAPGDEAPLCELLKVVGGAPIPAYSANMRVLMDSWNYHNLLPVRTGAVWDQVDNDRNNPVGSITNVRLVLIQFGKPTCSSWHVITLYSLYT